MRKNQTIELPVLPLRGLMLFPNMVLHFDVGRKKSLAALEQGMMEQQKIFLVSQKDDETEDPSWKDLCKVGTVAEIKQVMNLPGENIRVLVEGSVRGVIQDWLGDEPCMKAVIRLSADTWVTLSECRAYPLKQAPVSQEGPWNEGGYLVGETLPEGVYQCVIADMAPLSSYSVYDGILGTNAQLTKFEVLREAVVVSLAEGEYLELSGCTIRQAA